MSKIEWCDLTLNIITGCLGHGNGTCPYCYALKQAKRFKGYSQEATNLHYYGENLDNELYTENNGTYDLYCPLYKFDKDKKTVKAPYPFGFQPTFHRYRLDEPAKRKKPTTYFVGSMADMFGDWVPDEWIERVFSVCESLPQHKWLFLIKNPKRYVQLADKGILKPHANFWYGNTATTLIDVKMETLAQKFNTFLSIEPIQEEMILAPWIVCGNLKPIWKAIICGTETGNRADKTVALQEWIHGIVSDCHDAKIPIFLKPNLISIVGEDLVLANQKLPWRFANA